MSLLLQKRKRIWFYFPVWVRIRVPSRDYGRKETFDCPIWKAPYIWIREWMRWRRGGAAK